MKVALVEVGEHRDLVVVLSRRNLLALLHKLEMPGSARTIVKAGPINLVVKAESDEEHYPKDRPEGPAGPMHHKTEEFIRSKS